MSEPTKAATSSSPDAIWPAKSATSDRGAKTRSSPASARAEVEGTVLLLEDDVRLSDKLVRRFERTRFVIDLVETMADARAAITARRYDCLILDRVVSDGDALELVEELCARRNRPPILILSSLGDAADRIKVLRLGADEYLVRPFRPDEVLLRVRALLARHALADGWVVEWGSVVFDRARRRVTIDGEEVHLTPRQFSVFNYLILNADRLVSAEELLEHCWDGKRSSGNPIHTQINHLRRLFRGHLRFEIVHGYGYIVKTDDRDEDTGGGEDDGDDGDHEDGGSGGGGTGGKDPKDNSHIGDSGTAGAGGGQE